MNAFLLAFTAFDAVLALAALQRARNLTTAEGRARWASRRLYAIACVAAWTLPAICLLAITGAWGLAHSERAHLAGPVILLPVGWLLFMGTFFAVVDVAEDGVLDFGRGPIRRP